MKSSPSDQLKAVRVDFDDAQRRMIVERADGAVASVPLAGFPRLAKASAEELRDWRFIGDGVGIHWERVDEDLLVDPLFQPTSYSLGRIQQALRATEQRLGGLTLSEAGRAQTEELPRSNVSLKNNSAAFVQTT